MAATSDQELAIHQKLLAGDVTASAQVAELFLRKIDRALRRQFPNIKNDDLIHDAATDAVLSYIRRPSSYDPSKRSLAGFLKMSAVRDLQNRLSPLRKRAQMEIGLDSVEEIVWERNKRGESELDRTLPR